MAFSLKNILSNLSNLYEKNSPNTNFHTFENAIAKELDLIKRELLLTKKDLAYVATRDDYLYDILGSMVKLEHFDFFIPTNFYIKEVQVEQILEFGKLNVYISWETDLAVQGEAEYTEQNPYDPRNKNPIYSTLNVPVQTVRSGNVATRHKVKLVNLTLNKKHYYRIKFPDLNYISYSQFEEFVTPETLDALPIIAFQDVYLRDDQRTYLEMPDDSDPLGFAAYRQALFALLKALLDGPKNSSIELAVSTLLNLPVSIQENFKRMSNIEETGFILKNEEHLLHSFEVRVLMIGANIKKIAERALAIEEIVRLVKPAHKIHEINYIFPDHHMMTPQQNPYGIKEDFVDLEPTSGKFGEKVYINKRIIDIKDDEYYEYIRTIEPGCEKYYKSTDEYYCAKKFCNYAEYYSDYFSYYTKPVQSNEYYKDFYTTYGQRYRSQYYRQAQAGAKYGYSYPRTDYYAIPDPKETLDKNLIIIENGKRNVGAPFISNPNVTLHIQLDKRKPTQMLIEGDIEKYPNGFVWIPFQEQINVLFTDIDGTKRVKITLRYPSGSALGSGNILSTVGEAMGDVVIEGVTVLAKTMPDVLAQEYIETETFLEAEVLDEEKDVLYTGVFKTADIYSRTSSTGSKLYRPMDADIEQPDAASFFYTSRPHSKLGKSRLYSATLRNYSMEVELLEHEYICCPPCFKLADVNSRTAETKLCPATNHFPKEGSAVMQVIYHNEIFKTSTPSSILSDPGSLLAPYKTALSI